MYLGQGCSGYFLGQKFERKLFIGSANHQLLFWVYEMPNYFLGLECEKSLRTREKYGLLTKLDLFFTNCR